MTLPFYAYNYIVIVFTINPPINLNPFSPKFPKKKPRITSASAPNPFSYCGNSRATQSLVFAHRQPWVTKKKLAGHGLGLGIDI
jgi:hypothetical protein